MRWYSYEPARVAEYITDTGRALGRVSWPPPSQTETYSAVVWGAHLGDSYHSKHSHLAAAKRAVEAEVERRNQRTAS